MHKNIFIGSLIGGFFLLCSSVYSAENPIMLIGKVVSGSSTQNTSINTDNLKTDPQNLGNIVCGLQGDLTANTTIYFYGYVDSYSIVSTGGDSSFSLNTMNGYKSVLDGFGFGDNFGVHLSSPSVLIVNVGVGATVGYTIKGVVYKDRR